MRIELGWENGSRLQLVGDDVGHGEPVVLVHGWPCSSMVWEDLRAELLAAGYRVVTYDRRGFGRSARPSTGYDLDTLTEDLARVMDVLALQNATVVGFDAGCCEVMRLLGTFGEARVARLALVSPLPLVPCGGADGQQGPTMQRLRDALGADRHQALSAYLAVNFRTSDAQHLAVGQDVFQFWLQDACNNSAHAIRSMLSAGYLDLQDDAVRIGVPTLVMTGDSDQLVPFTDVEALASALSLVRHVSVPGASHGLLATHTPALARALLAFISGAESA